MNCASAYMYDGKIVIASEHQTTAGVWVSDRLASAFTPEDHDSLGSGLLEALSRSQQGVPHPTDWKGIFDSVIDAAGVKTFKAFMRSAKHVGIEARDGILTLRPSRNVGAQDGFEPKSGNLTAGSEASVAGAALVAAFAEAD